MKKVLKLIWVFFWGFIFFFVASGVDSLADNGKYMVMILGLCVPILMIWLGHRLVGYSELLPDDRDGSE